MTFMLKYLEKLPTALCSTTMCYIANAMQLAYMLHLYMPILANYMLRQSNASATLNNSTDFS